MVQTRYGGFFPARFIAVQACAIRSAVMLPPARAC